MLERLSWKRLVFELILCCIPAFLLGAFLGHLPWFLLASVTGLLIWHFWNLLRLSWWLWVDRSMTPPPGSGSWEPLLYGLHQMQMRNKKRRRELGSLIKRFRSGAESLPDAVILTTEEGTIFWCNGLAQQLLGLRWPDDNGQNILNLLRYPEFTLYLKKRDFTRPHNLKLNNGRHLEIRVMPYSDKQWLMVARDVTQMHQLEGARRNFFANVSHELRTPLTVLQGYLEMMQEQTLEGAPREKALHTMREQTHRMEGLVKQLKVNHAEAMKTITKHDRELMEKIRLYRIQTQDQRDELNKEKEELADQKKDLEKKQEELQALEEENQKLIDELNVQSSETESDLAAAEAAKEDYVSQLDQLIADRNAQAEKEEEARRQAEANQNAANNNSGSGNTSSGSGNTSDVLNTGDLSFSWPLAGYGYGSITQYFGGMFSGSPHGGVDIGVPYGTPIYAAESGQVISAEYHWSWGNNVLIWHNGTYSTRYAHCSSLAVSAGEYVEKGQIVGYVGSTGQSTGNHLHFEVYQNGTRVDPLNFV